MRVDGYDNALLLNQRGTVAEAADACIAMIRKGRLVTPPATSGILACITRATIMQLAQEHLALPVEEREIDRRRDSPVISIDRVPNAGGLPGEMTLSLQDRYFSIARRLVSDHPEWRSAVYKHAPAKAAR